MRAIRPNLTRCLVNNNSPDDSSAEPLADYFERVQWAVRPVTIIPHHEPARALDVNCNQISFKELREAVAFVKFNILRQTIKKKKEDRPKAK